MGDKMSDKTNEPVKELKGLTEQEVELRVEQGLDNRADTTTDKSIKEIIFSNAFTYFNLIFLIISILLLCVKSYRNLTFLPIVIGNTLIGIVQELRAKKILDKMNLLNAPHATVLREGMQKQILSEELVKDDIVVLRAGDQICADATVFEGNVQVNESLLTGEADEVEKKAGSCYQAVLWLRENVTHGLIKWERIRIFQDLRHRQNPWVVESSQKWCARLTRLSNGLVL